jgi:hypothetical protein
MDCLGAAAPRSDGGWRQSGWPSEAAAAGVGSEAGPRSANGLASPRGPRGREPGPRRILRCPFPCPRGPAPAPCSAPCSNATPSLQSQLQLSRPAIPRRPSAAAPRPSNARAKAQTETWGFYRGFSCRGRRRLWLLATEPQSRVAAWRPA